jgi:hypothetical protein
MIDAIVVAGLLTLNIYIAWRYSKMPVESDFGIFAMWGMTGAVYGRDFVDCKSPGVHIWLMLLAKIKRDIKVVRFLHFMATGMPSIIYYLVTKDYAGALAFLILIHSGWLYAFHGNVGDIPAGLIFLALITGNPWLFVALLVVATFYEPKLVVATGLMILIKIQTVWLPTLVYGMVIGALVSILYLKFRQVFDWIVESSYTIPKRMISSRKGLYKFMPSFTSIPFMYILPWLFAGIYSKPELLYWLPAIIMIAFQFVGKVIRPNHLLPLAAWVAAAGIRPEIVFALATTDLLSAGLYIGNIWARFYPGLDAITRNAKQIGEWLKDKPGILWVNSMWAQIYMYANKKPHYGMMEVVEVNSVAKERTNTMVELIKQHPPDWIVTDATARVGYDYRNYRNVAKVSDFIVYKRVR